MLQSYNPQMVFFMDTKLDNNRMVSVRRSCGFVNEHEVDFVWHGGMTSLLI